MNAVQPYVKSVHKSITILELLGIAMPLSKRLNEALNETVFTAISVSGPEDVPGIAGPAKQTAAGISKMLDYRGG